MRTADLCRYFIYLFLFGASFTWWKNKILFRLERQISSFIIVMQRCLKNTERWKGDPFFVSTSQTISQFLIKPFNKIMSSILKVIQAKEIEIKYKYKQTNETEIHKTKTKDNIVYGKARVWGNKACKRKKKVTFTNSNFNRAHRHRWERIINHRPDFFYWNIFFLVSKHLTIRWNFIHLWIYNTTYW
jgi:hypothetical protein